MDEKETGAEQNSIPKGGLKQNKKRKVGYIWIFCGLFALLAGVWLMFCTRGTRLLFTDVWLGKISRFYGIGILVAVISFVVGFLYLKKYPKPQNKSNHIEAAGNVHLDDIQQTLCPGCGKQIAENSKFCIYCGRKMQENRNNENTNS